MAILSRGQTLRFSLGVKKPRTPVGRRGFLLQVDQRVFLRNAEILLM